MDNSMVRLMVFIIRLYQKFISPVLPPVCRFHPTCSEYSVQAFREYGFIRGILLSIFRILKCNPLSKGGYDPVRK